MCSKNDPGARNCQPPSRTWKSPIASITIRRVRSSSSGQAGVRASMERNLSPPDPARGRARPCGPRMYDRETGVLRLRRASEEEIPSRRNKDVLPSVRVRSAEVAGRGALLADRARRLGEAASGGPEPDPADEASLRG